jgi:peptidoglycan/LPS O-acetylase OafA/YrhL
LIDRSNGVDISSNVSDKDELFGTQMLRGLAALAVVTHHTLEQSNGASHPFSPDWLTTSGASGADIFFVISDFIMLFVSFQQSGPANAR